MCGFTFFPHLPPLQISDFFENRLTLQSSFPLAPVLSSKVHNSNSLSTLGLNVPGGPTSPGGPGSASAYGVKWKLLEAHLSQQLAQQMSAQETNSDSPNASPSSNKRFRFSSLRNRHSLSTETSTTSARNSSLEVADRNEAYILAFQRELQNLPKPESPTTPYNNATQTALAHSLASILRETFQRTIGTPLKRPRSCSVPKITLENFSQTLLQLPTMTTSSEKGQTMPYQINALIRSATSDVSCPPNQAQQNSAAGSAGNSAPLQQPSCSPISAVAIVQQATSPSLSPMKSSPRNLNESPLSFHSTTGRSNSRSGSRSGSDQLELKESLFFEQKVILKLLHDWVTICPYDFTAPPIRREFVDFLARIASSSEAVKWMVEEILMQCSLEVSPALTLFIYVKQNQNFTFMFSMFVSKTFFFSFLSFLFCFNFKFFCLVFFHFEKQDKDNLVEKPSSDVLIHREYRAVSVKTYSKLFFHTVTNGAKNPEKKYFIIFVSFFLFIFRKC